MPQGNKLLSSFLADHLTKDKDNITHTRIGNKDYNVGGGAYCIPDDDLSEFYKLYYNAVFNLKQEEYLTEKQYNIGPICIDLDFRYSADIDERQHNETHITNILNLYISKLNEILEFDQNNIDIFVFEKDNVNTSDVNKTKDGIHILINININKNAQCYLRDLVLENINDILNDLPLINTYEDVIDNGIVKGSNNWQLYGSRKPGYDDYKLTYIFSLQIFENKNIKLIKSDDDFIFNDINHFRKLTVRNKDNPTFNIKYEIKEKLIKFDTKKKNNIVTQQYNMLSNEILNDGINVDISTITNSEILDSYVNILLEKLKETILNSSIIETHEYVMILPEKYYGSGSYNLWMRVGWALKNTSNLLFLTWIKFSSQSSEFDYSDIPSFYEKWCNFNSKSEENLTKASIMYWAKNDNPTEYKKIKRKNIDTFIERSINNATDYDIANILHQCYKDEFICSSIKHNEWYQFQNNMWIEIDSGFELENKLSNEIWELYFTKNNAIIMYIAAQTNNADNNDQEGELKKKSEKILNILKLLRSHSKKSSIMKEARTLFYKKDFIQNIDNNPNILCFNNYVVDFKEKRHRKGYPDDYITKSTNLDYIILNEEHEPIINEITNFMNELFPNENLNKYMWEHIASLLIGKNTNQTFNIYTGTGANGKSVFVELMQKCLGDYKGTVPISLVTQKRNSIGSTSSEVADLYGVRYAVMQEPSKGDKINEGIMKEITGGDPIQARGLYKNPITFIPQFKLAVCTNCPMDIESNDDGTWRRIRVCPFSSKFTDNPNTTENPDNNDKFDLEQYPHQFKLNRNLNERFDVWAPVLMSMLVNIAYDKQGLVNDCEEVLCASNKYRQNQDYLAQFVKEKIIKRNSDDDDVPLKRTLAWTEFQLWYRENHGKNIPKQRDLLDHLEKVLGRLDKGKWKKYKLIYDDDEET